MPTEFPDDGVKSRARQLRKAREESEAESARRAAEESAKARLESVRMKVEGEKAKERKAAELEAFLTFLARFHLWVVENRIPTDQKGRGILRRDSGWILYTRSSERMSTRRVLDDEQVSYQMVMESYMMDREGILKFRGQLTGDEWRAVPPEDHLTMVDYMRDFIAARIAEGFYL